MTHAWKNYWNGYIARFSYVTRRECETKPRMQKTLNRCRVPDRRIPIYSNVHSAMSRDPVTDHKSSRYRRGSSAPPRGTPLPLLTLVSVEFRSPFLFYSVQGRCGWSMWVNREHQDYPDPATLRAFVFLRRVLDCSCVANCESLAWRAVAGILRRNRYAGVHNDPIASQHSGDYLTMTRDKAPYIKANEGDANR